MINSASPDFLNTPVHPLRPRYRYYSPHEPTGARQDDNKAMKRGGATLHIPRPTGLEELTAPMVTIVTPYYNPGDIFKETVACVLHQSCQNFEWIIVNDGSDDPFSLELLAQLERQDSRVKVIHQANQGPAVARNQAVKAAKAEYIFQIDADDLVEPTFVEKCLWFLESHPEYGFCNSWSIGFGESNYLWPRGFETGINLLDENCVPPPAVIRRRAHLETGGYDETIRYGHEDWDYWLNLAKHGYWGHTIPEYHVWYRRRSGTRITETQGDSQKEHAFRQFIQQKYAPFLEQGFPNPQPPPTLPYAAVSTTQPFQNLINKPKNIKRVLMILPWLAVGGADAANLDIIRQLTPRGYEFTLCTTLPSSNPWLPEFAKVTPDIFYLANFLSLNDFPRFIIYLIHSRQIDLLFISNSYLAYQLLPFLRAYCPPLPIVDYMHTEEEYWKNGGYPRASIGYQELLDFSITSTRHLKQWMVARGGKPERISACHTNIDVHEWNPVNFSVAKIRPEIDCPAETPLILYVGRMTEQKRPRVFAEVMRRLVHEEHLDFACLVIGEGEDLPFLKEFAQEHHLQNHLDFLGTITMTRLQALMAAADILFLPSKKEGISMTLFEALAMETVPVGADVGGQAELVTPECGYLIPHSETELDEYVRVLKALIESPELRQKLAKAGRERIVSHFGLEQMADRMEALLAKAGQLAQTAPRPPISKGLGLECATQAVEYTRLERVADELWQVKLSLEQQSAVGQPAAADPQVLINQLSGEDIAHRIPIKKLIKAIGFKLAKQPGLHWLYNFRQLGKQLVGE